MSGWYDPKGKPCPACGRKGLHFAMHPHAFGWKDYDRVECRFCHKRFKVAPPPSLQENDKGRT